MTNAGKMKAEKMNDSAGELTWRAHPARQRPGAAVLAALAVGAVAGACWLAGGPWWGLGAVVVMVASLSRFFFPSRFAIDGRGVTASYLFGSRHFDWPRIRRFRYDRFGVYLSTRSRQSRLDAYRGMHLLFGTVGDDVLRCVRAHMRSIAATTARGESA